MTLDDTVCVYIYGVFIDDLATSSHYSCRRILHAALAEHFFTTISISDLCLLPAVSQAEQSMLWKHILQMFARQVV